LDQTSFIIYKLRCFQIECCFNKKRLLTATLVCSLFFGAGDRIIDLIKEKRQHDIAWVMHVMHRVICALP